jgi:hypothetical protein
VVARGTVQRDDAPTSDEPYRLYLSLDGVHPSAAGPRIRAHEAAKALNTTCHRALPRGERLLALSPD